MTTLSVRVIGADKTSAGMIAAALGTAKAERVLVTRFGALLRTKISANASGRPGPRSITGTYRRRWTMRTMHLPTGPASEVGTNADQAKRLEYGFVGVDSLGRHYDQPPYPHVGPACDVIEPEFQAAAQALVNSL